MKRSAVVFFALLAGFLAIDWWQSRAHDRFAEPPPWAIGQEKIDFGAHCTSVPRS